MMNTEKPTQSTLAHADHRSAAAIQQEKDQSAWLVLKFVVFPISLWLTGFLVIETMLAVQNSLVPGVTLSAAGIYQHLFLLPLVAPIFGLSFIVMNIILFCIPPTRAVYKKQAGQDEETASFADTMRSLVKVNLKYFIPIGLLPSSFSLYMMSAA